MILRRCRWLPVKFVSTERFHKATSFLIGRLQFDALGDHFSPGKLSGERSERLDPQVDCRLPAPSNAFRPLIADAAVRGDRTDPITDCGDPGSVCHTDTRRIERPNFFGEQKEIRVGNRQLGVTCTSREGFVIYLLREVSHRSKNLLAIVQAMATQTAKSSPSFQAFQSRFSQRLQGSVTFWTCFAFQAMPVPFHM